jgi:tRNA-specific 2-thiouridylase
MTHHTPAHTKVIVGMSGGVDSSVSAYLLQQQGYQVEGLFMKNWEEDDGTEYCTAKEDYADALSVCQQLGIHLHQANFAAEYWDTVFTEFLHEYQAGRTPNPDILCNREIKFKAFLEYALTLGADAIATGHYARVQQDSNDRYLLRKGLDPQKDQSYFLHQVSSTQLAQTYFPLGELHKSDVRKIAQQLGLKTHNKKDSTGICFIGERRFRDFLTTYLSGQNGPIKSTEGVTLGEHPGLMYFTIGQRQGIGIGGVRDYPEAPWFVVDKDLVSNTLVVAQGTDHPRLFKQYARLESIFWINEPAPMLPLKLNCKHRYRQTDQACELLATDAGYEIHFKEPQRAVTPGQSAVFYLDDTCLGGGVIQEAWND